MAPSAGAQRPTTVASLTGVLFRTHGDTIWQEQDTVAYRTVVRHDTLVSTYLLDGRVMGTCTLLAGGGPALRPLTTTDTAGSAPLRLWRGPDARGQIRASCSRK